MVNRYLHRPCCCISVAESLSVFSSLPGTGRRRCPLVLVLAWPPQVRWAASRTACWSSAPRRSRKSKATGAANRCGGCCCAFKKRNYKVGGLKVTVCVSAGEPVNPSRMGKYKRKRKDRHLSADSAHRRTLFAVPRGELNATWADFQMHRSAVKYETASPPTDRWVKKSNLSISIMEPGR